MLARELASHCGLLSYKTALPAGATEVVEEHGASTFNFKRLI